LIRGCAQRWYAKDSGCQVWEPSGEDFLSPALIEAECMRRVLAPTAFRAWFAQFLPKVAQRRPATLFAPARVSDAATAGSCILTGSISAAPGAGEGSRNVCRQVIPFAASAAQAAERHLAASLPFLAHHYMGEHWLASFALLALRPPA